MSENNTSRGEIGFVGALTILFIALKLLDKIDWSWWWVLSPIWISICVALLIILIVIIFLLIAEWIKK